MKKKKNVKSYESNVVAMKYKISMIVIYVMIIGAIFAPKSLADETEIRDISFNDNAIYNTIKEKYLKEITNYNDEEKKVTINIKNVTDLDVRDTKDIGGIENLKYLKNCSLIGNENKTQINNLNKLKELNNLKEIAIWYTTLDDLSCINEIPSLENVEIRFCNVNNISELQVSKLKKLVIVDAQLSNIDNLKNANELENLNLSKNKIKDISALSNLTKIKFLDLHENEVEDISALSNLTNLITLNLRKNRIRDISALENLKLLSQVVLAENAIEDCSVLLKLPKYEVDSTYKLKNQSILIYAKSGEKIKLPKIVQQAFELYDKTRSIDEINCKVSDDHTTCTIKPDIETARIRISEGTFEGSTIIIKIADETTPKYVLNEESNLKKNDKNFMEYIKDNKVLVVEAVVGLLLICILVFVVIKNNKY